MPVPNPNSSVTPETAPAAPQSAPETPESPGSSAASASPAPAASSAPGVAPANTTSASEASAGLSQVKNASAESGSDLEARLQALQERLDAMERRRVNDERRVRFDASVARFPEGVRKAYSRLPIDSFDDGAFAALMADIEKEVSALPEPASGGALFSAPRRNAPSATVSDAEVDAIVARLL